MFIVWFKFLICAGAILLAGSQLSKSAEVIAEKTGLTKAWIGLVLLAVITSIPELANGISAVKWVGVPDLAIGNIFGACIYNMGTFAILWAIWAINKKTSIFNNISRGHAISGVFTISIIFFSCLAIVLWRFFQMPSFFGVGIFSFFIILQYLLAQWIVYFDEKKTKISHLVMQADLKESSLNQAVIKFIFFSMFVVAAGIWLPYIGEDISIVMGWQGSFVGVIFLGLATTLPEFVVSVSALFLGSPDMAVGNLFGSNLFNVSLLFIDDVFFSSGPLFAYVSIGNIYYGVAAMFVVSAAVALLFIKGKQPGSSS